jgi:hypothetical protein
MFEYIWYAKHVKIQISADSSLNLTYLLIFKVIGQRSRSPGQIFRRGDMPRFALPLLFEEIVSIETIASKETKLD